MILVASNQRGGPLFRMEWRDAAGRNSFSFGPDVAISAADTVRLAWLAWWRLRVGQFHDGDREAVR